MAIRVPRDVTQQDLEESLLTIICATGRDNRWATYQGKPMATPKLMELIQHHMGEYHGAGGPDMPWILAKGSGLRLWVHWTDAQPELHRKPNVAGMEVVHLVRRLLSIGEPSDPRQFQLQL